MYVGIIVIDTGTHLYRGLSLPVCVHMCHALYLSSETLFNLYVGQSGDGTLRLVGGESNHTGKLEIFHQTSFGGICSANFGAEESRVACFQLGFGGASRYYDYGSSQQTVLNSLTCEATGTWLANCTHGGWRTGVCSNGQAVGLECAGECSHNVDQLSIVGKRGVPV